MSTGGKFILLAAAAAVVVLIVFYGGGPATVEASPPTTVAGSLPAPASVPPPPPPRVASHPVQPASEGGVAQAPVSPSSGLTAASGGPSAGHDAIIEMGTDLSSGITRLLGPATRPAATETETRAASQSAPQRRITPDTTIVRSGDTLIAIARRELGNADAWSRLVEANPGINPRALKPGMVLKLPAAPSQPRSVTPAPAGAPRTHEVATGDSLSSISILYYGDAQRWYEVFEANRTVLKGDPDRLSLGDVLVIP